MMILGLFIVTEYRCVSSRDAYPNAGIERFCPWFLYQALTIQTLTAEPHGRNGPFDRLSPQDSVGR